MSSIAYEISKGVGKTNYGHPKGQIYSVKIFFIKSSDTLYAEGSGVVRDSDRVETNSPWGAKGNVSSGSEIFYNNGQKVARDGDKVTIQGGSGNITSGSEKLDSN